MRTEFNIIYSNWKAICRQIQEYGNLSDIKFRNFYIPLKPQSFENNTLYLFTEHYDKNLILEEIKNNVQQVLINQYNIECDIVFTNVDNYKVDKKPFNKIRDNGLDPTLTFENFIPGEHNIAHGCAMAVANAPGTTMNPLFLYGDSGLGKTHLLNAIGNQILKNYPDVKMIYTTTENLMQEYVDATRFNRLSEFKKKYRHDIDLLLVDDIQFLPANSDKLAEDFFHMFNHLISSRKQIVITADKPPKELHHIEDRLVTRFNQGTSVEVMVPNFETRMAIVKHLQENTNFTLDNQAISFIANSIKSNIRQIIGVMQKISNVRVMGFTNDVVTVKDVERLIKEYSDQENKEITIDLIINVVAEHCKVSSDGIIGKSRKKELVNARHIVMYLALSLTDLTQEQIGKSLGNRDHSTVSSGRDKINNELLTNKELEKNITAITNKLNVG